MSLLGDIRSQEVVPDKGRVLIHGQPGTGKTDLSATVAKFGKTFFGYFQGEEGMSTLNGHSQYDNLVIHRVESIPELEQLYADFRTGDHDFDCLVFDGLSALQTMWKKHLLGQPMDEPARDRPATDFAFWGALRDGFNDFLTFYYSLASHRAKRSIHVIMTAQTKMLEDATGDVKMQPDLHKGPLASAVSRPDHILYTFMREDPDDWEKQQHAVRLKPSHDVIAKIHAPRNVAEKLDDVVTDISLSGFLKAVGAAGT